MPLLAPIVLTDEESTPVSHTFSPVSSTSQGLSTFLERDPSGKPSLGSKLTIATSRVSGNGAFKRKIRIHIPVIELDANGVGQVVDADIIEIDCKFSKSSTDQARKNIMGMTSDLLGPDSALVRAVAVNLEGIW